MLRRKHRQQSQGQIPWEEAQRHSSSPKKAAALNYDASEDAVPRVVAKGRRKLAEEIVERARNAGVPIVEDGHLVDALLALQLDEEIPVELYAVVAEVLAWVLQLKAACRAADG